MTYLLDTNVISAIMREDGRMASWLSSLEADDRVILCPIARGEILFGLERLVEGKRRSELEVKAKRIFAALACDPIPSGAGDQYARVKVAQQRRGLSLDENDLWMAATALSMGVVLVTRDSDFRGVAGLSIVAP